MILFKPQVGKVILAQTTGGLFVIREKNTRKKSEKTLENSEIFFSLLSLGNPPQ